MPPLAVVPAPAKLNLFLAITGRRTDGFHDLVSVVAPLEWGDTLRAEAAGEFSLACDRPAVPVDETNLILKAARAFRAATGWSGGAKFFLEKRIPMGAGLGGGSSDAAAALRVLNEFAGRPLDVPKLESLAAQIGSDCPLFLRAAPVVMRGRGERVDSLPPAVRSRLRGQRVLVFKPEFGVSTPWAYAQLVARAPHAYLPPTEAESRLTAWMNDERASVESLLFNNMEPAAFAKFVALPALVRRLRERFQIAAHMSGSGSACFALLADATPVEAITAEIRAAWGASACAVETRLT